MAPHTASASALVRTSDGVRVIDLDVSSLDALTASLAPFEVLAADWAQPTFAHPLALSSTPSDPLFASQWGLTRLDIPATWPQADGTGVTIAVIDSGVTVSSELPNLLPGRNYVIDGTHPGISDTSDGNGHGTAVSHMAAAASDGSGMLGAAPLASVLPIRVLGNSGSGVSSDLASGIVYAVDHGAKVLNLSVGVSGTDATLTAAVAYAASNGVLMVAAAGNSGPLASPPSPASDDNTLAVAAIDDTDNPASFSQSGSYIDIAAPGVDIIGRSNDGQYYLWSGTSMATPLISGLAALLFSSHPEATASQVRQVLISSSQDVYTSGSDLRTGAGVPQATAALTLLDAMYPPSSTTTTTTTTTPTTTTTTTTPTSTTTTTLAPTTTTTQPSLPSTTSPVTAPSTTLAPTPSIPDSPSALRISVSTADLALSWQPSLTPGVVYEISRNGALVSTSSRTSFTDPLRAMSPGAYLYSVTAVSPESLRSAAVSSTFLVSRVTTPTLLSAAATRTQVSVRVKIPSRLPSGSKIFVYTGKKPAYTAVLAGSAKAASSVRITLPRSGYLGKGTYRVVVLISTPTGASSFSRAKTVLVR